MLNYFLGQISTFMFLLPVFAVRTKKFTWGTGPLENQKWLPVSLEILVRTPNPQLNPSCFEGHLGGQENKRIHFSGTKARYLR